jgi:type I restriction enzyme S subunit
MEVKPGYQQTEVGVIPDDWNIQTGEQVTTLIGKGGSPRWQGFAYTDKGMLFVTSENVRDGFLDVSHPKYLPIAFHEKIRRTKIYTKDILVNLVGASIGRSCQILQDIGEANVNQAVAVFRVGEGNSSKFVAYYFQAPATVKRILEMQVDAARPNISLGDLRRFPIPLPPLSEQRAIAEALSDVDALLGALDRLIVKKRNIKQAAMQQLLTGQTRLPGFSEEWGVCLVEDVIANSFCGPSPTCEERNIGDQFEWGVLKTTAATVDSGWNWRAHKVLPQAFWHQHHIELCKGDVIVTKAGPRHRVGVAVWIDFVPPRIIPSGKMIALRPDPKKTVPLLLASAISTPAAQTFLDQRTTGMAESQVNFENTVLLKTPIQLPGIMEQAAIATVLSDMSAELEAFEQRRAKTAALKQGMMQELLTGRTRLV